MNTSQITITIEADKDVKQIFETLKQVGVTDATLNGNTVTGTAATNIVNSLRSIVGVSDVTIEGIPSSTPPPIPTPTHPMSTATTVEKVVIPSSSHNPRP